MPAGLRGESEDLTQAEAASLADFLGEERIEDAPLEFRGMPSLSSMTLMRTVRAWEPGVVVDITGHAAAGWSSTRGD